MSSTFFTPDSRWIGGSKSGTVKLAWKRNPDVPAGQPAPGRFDCVCGNTITDVKYAGPDSQCGTCSRIWDGHGWLISEPG